MLHTTYLRDNRQEAIDRLAKRGFDATALVDEIIALDDLRKSSQTTLDSILAESNKLAKEIGDLFKQGKTAEANSAKQKTVELKEQSNGLQSLLQTTEIALQEKLYLLPNTPHSSVPKGKSAEDNETVSEHGTMPKLPANALPHWELAKKYGIIDFEMGVKVTGAGFPVYAGQGARLQRALINFFLDEAHKAGYKEYIPPFMVNQASGYGTGQLPDKEGQMYYMPADDFYMVPTAEVPLTNFFRDVILKSEELPVKLTAYTPCFRREAGSYGKDVKGLNRLHQFDKVEIVQVAQAGAGGLDIDRVEPVAGFERNLAADHLVLRLGIAADVDAADAVTTAFGDAIGDLHRVARGVVDVRNHGGICVSTRPVVAANHVDVGTHFLGRVGIAADQGQCGIEFIGTKDAHLAEAHAVNGVLAAFVDRNDQVHLAVAGGHALDSGAGDAQVAFVAVVIENLFQVLIQLVALDAARLGDERKDALFLGLHHLFQVGGLDAAVALEADVAHFVFHSLIDDENQRGPTVFAGLHFVADRHVRVSVALVIGFDVATRGQNLFVAQRAAGFQFRFLGELLFAENVVADKAHRFERGAGGHFGDQLHAAARRFGKPAHVIDLTGFV